MKTFSAGKTRICRDQSIGVPSHGWVAGPDGRKKKAMEDLFDFEDWGKPLLKKDCVRVVCRSSGWLQIHCPQMSKEKLMEHLVDERWQQEK